MSAAAEAASIPDQAAIERAEAFTRERFVHDGEDPAVALAPGSARRRALDDALREIDAGAKVPSTKWRRRYALLLGLERVLSEDEPRLADGALLNPHQVDALSGTLTALLAAVQNGHSLAAPTAEPVLAVDDEPEPETPAAAAPDEPDDDDEPELDADEDDDEDDDEPESRPSPTRTTRTRTRTTTSRSPTTRTTRTTSPRTPGRTTPSPTSTRTSRRAPPTTPTPTSASGSSTRPAPARPSPRWASSRPRAPAAS